MSLVELLTAVAIVGILAGTSINASRVPLAHQQLLAAARQLERALSRPRSGDGSTGPRALALGRRLDSARGGARLAAPMPLAIAGW